MVDKILIMRKLTELETYINQIQEYSNITVKEYSQYWKIQRIIERTLQMMIELCVDIANHVIADENFKFQSIIVIPLKFWKKHRLYLKDSMKK